MSGLWVLLSDNNGSPGPQWPTGCTYTYDKAPTNPGDANGRRLLDGDRPYADWNTCVGHNWEDLAVTFDLQGLRRLARVRVSMPLPQRPRAVEVAARGKPEDKWHDVAKIEPSAESGSPGWFELPLSTLEPARQVRLTFRLKEWGFYIREVELWGLPDDGAAAPASGTIVVGNSPGAKSVAAAYDLKLHLEGMFSRLLVHVRRTACRCPGRARRDRDGGQSGLPCTRAGRSRLRGQRRLVPELRRLVRHRCGNGDL
jgi:hypothetical protein